MPIKSEPPSQTADWNVLTSPWLEAVTLDAQLTVCSPLEALRSAAMLRCLASASPVDLFAAHRFLLTLLYWKADVAGGVAGLRTSLLSSRVPTAVIDAIEAEASHFRLFDDKAPFLQDPLSRNAKKKSAGYFFSEYACGTNIAHFHHGDDAQTHLCYACVTAGLLRVVPWMQSGGAGLTPAVHGAPPIVALALGDDFAATLGLNLVPLTARRGKPTWSGQFKPTDPNGDVSYLEAFTWNARRIHLLSPQETPLCWRCGRRNVPGVGQVIYEKNQATEKPAAVGKQKNPFQWADPAGFYTTEQVYRTAKSRQEGQAAWNADLHFFRSDKGAPTSAVVKANAAHREWRLIVPCTDGKAKTFDHRQIELDELSPDAIRRSVTVFVPVEGPEGRDGWTPPPRSMDASAASKFTRTAARLLTAADWVAVANAAGRSIEQSPAAFDVLSGLLWPLRAKIRGLPSRQVAWLVLKLMATAPASSRSPATGGSFSPLNELPRRQLQNKRELGSASSRYPQALPRGKELECALRASLERNFRSRHPQPVDWARLCADLDQLLD